MAADARNQAPRYSRIWGPISFARFICRFRAALFPFAPLRGGNRTFRPAGRPTLWVAGTVQRIAAACALGEILRGTAIPAPVGRWPENAVPAHAPDRAEPAPRPV